VAYGRASHPTFHPGIQHVAPSAIPLSGTIHSPIGKVPNEIPRALETDEIPRIVEDYSKAAANCKLAGFDGVEIHSANGYLLDEFLQSLTNKRTDRYGGTLENRFRFLKEVIAGVASVYPRQRIGVRLSPNGNYNDMGSDDFRESFLYYSEQLSKENLAYLHVVDGLAFGFHNKGVPLTLKDIRAVYSGTIIGNCGYNLETAEAAVESGEADLIAIGRPLISNPDLVERYKNGWPLAVPNDKTFFTYTSEGYTDYPPYSSL